MASQQNFVPCFNTLLYVFMTGLHSTYSLINFQYQYISEPRTWPKAQAYCRKVHIDLAIVENMSNMTSLLQTVNSHEGKMWIGLERISASQESWGWSGKNKTSSFQYWMSGKPDNYGKGENCAAIDMNSGGQWDDLSCELNLPFICLGGGSTVQELLSLSMSLSFIS